MTVPKDDLVERLHTLLGNEGWFDELADWAESAAAEIERLRAENESLRVMLNTYNLGGWTDSLRILQRAERAEIHIAELEAENARLTELDAYNTDIIARFAEKLKAAEAERDRMLAVIEAAKVLEAEASKRLRFRDAERYPELCAALTQVRTALAALNAPAASAVAP